MSNICGLLSFKELKEKDIEELMDMLYIFAEFAKKVEATEEHNIPKENYRRIINTLVKKSFVKNCNCNCSLEELRKLSIEELIVKLLTIESYDATKTEKQNKEKILKILGERNIIDFDKVKRDLININIL